MANYCLRQDVGGIVFYKHKVKFKTKNSYFSGEPELGTGRVCLPSTILYKLS